MRDSDRDTTRTEQLAFSNLESALQMMEGELWRSSHQMRGLALAQMRYAKRFIRKMAEVMDLEDSSSQ